jgi:hypothetical protein
MDPKRRVFQRLGDRHIRVLEICIFPDEGNGHFVEEAFLAVTNKEEQNIGG